MEMTGQPVTPAEPPRDKAVPAWLWSGGLIFAVLALLLAFARG